jgi:hypothetical protein
MSIAAVKSAASSSASTVPTAVTARILRMRATASDISAARSRKLLCEFGSQRWHSNSQDLGNISFSGTEGDHRRNKTRRTVSDAVDRKHFVGERAGEIADIVRVRLGRPVLEPMVACAVSQQIAVAHSERGADIVESLGAGEVGAADGVPVDLCYVGPTASAAPNPTSADAF